MLFRPLKSRPLSLSLLKNASFGLQSPDTLPCSLLSEAELHQITSTLGLDGSQLEDLLLLFPDNFCFDNEIIDLTLMQMPKTPNENGAEEQLIATFSANIKPPTPFQDDHQTDFAEVMKRLGHGDTSVISESHTKVSQGEFTLGMFQSGLTSLLIGFQLSEKRQDDNMISPCLPMGVPESEIQLKKPANLSPQCTTRLSSRNSSKNVLFHHHQRLWPRTKKARG